MLAKVRDMDEIIPALEAANGSVDALYVASDQLTRSNRDQILTFALVSKLPTAFQRRGFVAAGGLVSCVPNFPKQFEGAATLVDKILRGASPADLPVEQPKDVALVINIKTAKALGLTVPPSLLSGADEVIE